MSLEDDIEILRDFLSYTHHEYADEISDILTAFHYIDYEFECCQPLEEIKQSKISLASAISKEATYIRDNFEKVTTRKMVEREIVTTEWIEK